MCTPSAIILELLPTVYGGIFLVFPINLWNKVHEQGVLSREKVPELGGLEHELSNWQGLCKISNINIISNTCTPAS